MATVLNNPTLTVNDINIKIVPNSVSYNDGDGEVTLRTQTTGTTVEVVQSVNAETQISMVKFSMISTPENSGLVRTWLRSGELNTLTLSQKDTDFTRSYRNSVVTNNPEIAIGHDAVIEIEFKGERAA